MTMTTRERCEICGLSHAAAVLSCNESKLVYALGDRLFGAEREDPEARASIYEKIAAVFLNVRP